MKKIEFYKFINSVINLYGLLTYGEVNEIYAHYFNEKLDQNVIEQTIKSGILEGQISAAIFRNKYVHSLELNKYDNKERIIKDSIEESSHKKRYYPDLDELYQYEDPNYIDDTNGKFFDATIKALNKIKNPKIKDKKEYRFILIELQKQIKWGLTVGIIFQNLQVYGFEFMGMEDTDVFLNQFMKFINSTRRVMNRGYAPVQMTKDKQNPNGKSGFEIQTTEVNIGLSRSEAQKAGQAVLDSIPKVFSILKETTKPKKRGVKQTWIINEDVDWSIIEVVVASLNLYGFILIDDLLSLINRYLEISLTKGHLEKLLKKEAQYEDRLWNILNEKLVVNRALDVRDEHTIDIINAAYQRMENKPRFFPNSLSELLLYADSSYINDEANKAINQMKIFLNKNASWSRQSKTKLEKDMSWLIVQCKLTYYGVHLMNKFLSKRGYELNSYLDVKPYEKLFYKIFYNVRRFNHKGHTINELEALKIQAEDDERILNKRN